LLFKKNWLGDLKTDAPEIEHIFCQQDGNSFTKTVKWDLAKPNGHNHISVVSPGNERDELPFVVDKLQKKLHLPGRMILFAIRTSKIVN
jgi:hypothetical protein